MPKDTVEEVRFVPRFNILYVITSLAVGGSERHLAAIASRLARSGHKVTIYCLYGRGPFAAEPEHCGVRVLGPAESSAAVPPGRIRWYLGLVVSIMRLYVLMLKERPPISHFFGPPACVIGGVLARGAGLGRLVASRRSMNDYQANYPRLARFEHRAHQRMAAILGNSKAVVEQLRNEENAPAERLALIYNGINLQPFDLPAETEAVRASLDTGADDFVIAIVANLIPYKGHSDLLDALADIQDQLPRNWKLWIIGRDQGIGRQLAQQGTERGLTDHLRFLDVRHDVPELLTAADAAVSSSHQEGFSNAILEAMAAALPVIATNAGGNAEAVIDGATGYVVPISDTKAMASALLKLAADREACARMGRAGRARVEQFFSLNACVAQYEDLYRAIMAGEPIAKDVGTAMKPDRAQAERSTVGDQ